MYSDAIKVCNFSVNFWTEYHVFDFVFEPRGSAGSAYHWTEQQPIGLGKR